MLQENHRALIYIILLSIVAFQVARQFLPSAISQKDFSRWLVLWLGTSVIAFLTSNFWLYIAFMSVFLVVMLAREPLKPTIYILLLSAMPIANVSIPGFAGIQKLIDMNHMRFLSLLVLLPLLLFQKNNAPVKNKYAGKLDFLIFSYIVLLSALQLRNFEATHAVRIFLSLFLDIFLPYFILSRMICNIQDLIKCLYAFVLAAMAISLIGVVEMLKYWHLYLPLHYQWSGALIPGAYLERSGLLRAYASIVPFSIAFGLIMAVAMAFLLGMMKSFDRSKLFYATYGYLAAFGILGLGLVSSLSRGPWIGAMIVLFVYFATGPRFFMKLAVGAVMGVIAFVPLLLTSFGNKILGILPFFGHVETENITYREELLHYSFKLIQRYPLFGTPDYLSTPEMQAMVNGDGLIDIVNTYLQVAIETGLVGLSLFVSIFGLLLFALFRAIWNLPEDQQELHQIGRGLLAALVCVLVTIFTVSSVGQIPYLYWMLAGLCVAYIRLAYKFPVAAPAVPMPRSVKTMTG